MAPPWMRSEGRRARPGADHHEVRLGVRGQEEGHRVGDGNQIVHQVDRRQAQFLFQLVLIEDPGEVGDRGASFHNRTGDAERRPVDLAIDLAEELAGDFLQAVVARAGEGIFCQRAAGAIFTVSSWFRQYHRRVTSYLLKPQLLS